MIGFGQNVNIPDANFKAYLVGSAAINTNGDAEIQESEAATYGSSIVCPSLNIADLTGIEDFTDLILLYCNSNNLITLDLSNNTALVFLKCENNQLTTLDLSNNIALASLDCGNNQLTSLNVRNGNNINWNWDKGKGFSFEAYFNPNLFCIDVDDVAWSDIEVGYDYVTGGNAGFFSENCGGKGKQKKSY